MCDMSYGALFLSVSIFVQAVKKKIFRERAEVVAAPLKGGGQV